MGIQNAILDFLRHFLTKGANRSFIRILSRVRCAAASSARCFAQDESLPEAPGAPLRGGHAKPALEGAREHAQLGKAQQFANIRKAVPGLLQATDGQLAANLVKLRLKTGVLGLEFTLQGAQTVAHALGDRLRSTVPGRQEAVNHMPHLLQKIAPETLAQVFLQLMRNRAYISTNSLLENLSFKYQPAELTAKCHGRSKVATVVTRLLWFGPAEIDRTRTPVLATEHVDYVVR